MITDILEADDFIEFLNTCPQQYSVENSNVHKDLSTLFWIGVENT